MDLFVNMSPLPYVNVSPLPYLHVKEKNQMLHPINLENSEVTLTVAAVYTVLFFIGIFGNFSVLTVMWKCRKAFFFSAENGILYIFFLCLVDFVVVLSMPLSINQILVGYWILGQPLCTIYWTLESGGKVISGLMLTALSFDRFIGVCFPMLSKLRSKQFTIRLILCLMIVSFILLLPLPIYARAEKKVLLSNHFVRGELTQFFLLQCSTHSMPNHIFKAFIIYMFIFGFCLPAVCITMFYSLMISKLRRHIRHMSQSSIPVRRIGIYTFAITAFYFLCWLPYWAGTLFLLSETGVNKGGPLFVYIMYCVHALPYLNSALNWIFYSMLNTQFREISNRESYDITSIPHSVNEPNSSQISRCRYGAVGSQRLLPMQSLRIPVGADHVSAVSEEVAL